MTEIYTIEYEHEAYPPLLRLIENPPQRLYCLGRQELLHKPALAVVGTRKPTEYGKWAAHKIGQRLAENDIVTVSGMAVGVDSYAHKGALSADGDTIAVLGGGIDICAREGNRRIFAEIRDRGLVISEYPPGFPAAKYTFPQRNRIISGLAVGTVVVEAGMNSGSLITAELAAEQGRRLFALPGNITSPMSFGTNQLICDGAEPVAVIDGLIEDVFGRVDALDKIFLDSLGEDEKRVMAALSENGEMNVNSLSRELSIPAGSVNGILTVLEMKGLIKNGMGKIFIAK